MFRVPRTKEEDTLGCFNSSEYLRQREILISFENFF